MFKRVLNFSVQSVIINEESIVSLHKLNRKVQEVPQSQTGASPNTKRKRKITKTSTHKTNKCTRSTQTSSLLLKQDDHNAKRDDETRGQTLKHQVPRSINHKATQNKNNHRLRTVSSINYRGFKNIFNCGQTSPWVSMYFLIQKYIKSSVRIMAP